MYSNFDNFSLDLENNLFDRIKGKKLKLSRFTFVKFYKDLCLLRLGRR